MQLDPWYDLAVRELSELTDPAAERRAEAEEIHAALPGLPGEDEDLPDAAPAGPPGEDEDLPDAA